MGRTCAIGLLGGFRATIEGREIPREAWRRRGADLVKLLALAPAHRLHREQVMDALWPDLDPKAAAANLRKAVHFARRAFGSDQAIGGDREMISLWPEGARWAEARVGVADCVRVVERQALWTPEVSKVETGVMLTLQCSNTGLLTNIACRVEGAPFDRRKPTDETWAGASSLAHASCSSRRRRSRSRRSGATASLWPTSWRSALPPPLRCG
jgi:hypothetical protein